MSLLPQSPAYTEKDFDSLRARLISLVESVFPDWSDFDVASFGNVLLEMYAFVGDVLTFYLDNQARESRLSTATQRKNVLALARMLGYRLHGAQAATAEITFTLARPSPADVIIPAGQIVRTPEVTEPVRFQLLTDVTIPKGALLAHGVVENSQTRTQRFDARGLANLDLALNFTPYLDGSARVSTVSGEFTEVDNLLNSTASDRHFVVLVDQHDRALLRFGNQVSGAAPTGTIQITYKTGGGAGGDVDASSLVVIEGALIDLHGHPVQISVTNPSPAGGGTDRERIASAKLRAPESLRALTRSITREDFEINARRIPSVARALMLTSNEDPTIDENAGILYVIPRDGGLPTPALKNAVLTQVTRTYPCPLTFQVAVQSPVYRVIDVEARVHLRQGHPEATVRDRIRAHLVDLFRVSEPDGTPNPLVDFGFNIKDADGYPVGEIAWSDVFNAIRDAVGVRKLGEMKLNGLSTDVALAIREFPRLGDVTLINGDTGETL